MKKILTETPHDASSVQPAVARSAANADVPMELVTDLLHEEVSSSFLTGLLGLGKPGQQAHHWQAVGERGSAGLPSTILQSWHQPAWASAAACRSVYQCDLGPAHCQANK